MEREHAEQPESRLPADVNDSPIVFYDGECALCNRFVRWLIRRDGKGRFRFASLQGETAAQALGEPSADPNEWTVILLDQCGEHERSEAVLRILRSLGGVWSTAAIFRIIPRALRDAMYRYFARRRFRWFGKAESCELPGSHESQRFLP